MAHPFRVQLNLVFFDVSAQHGYLCHPSGGPQRFAHEFVGEGYPVVLRVGCPVGVEVACCAAEFGGHCDVVQHGELFLHAFDKDHELLAQRRGGGRLAVGILISSFGCSPETAAFDFKFALSKTNQADPNKAFHLIQAFAPGEVSYKEAHQIGVELANKLLEGKFSYIVSTHIDKGHVHNHIIFCAADNVNHEKYHDCKQTYYHIRRLNDELCSKHQLSVISPTNQRGKSYKEWTSGRNGTSWKIKLKQDIDEAIQNADTYEQCMELIRAKGYEIKGETIGENALKYISFRPLDREHFVRGSLKSLGAEYAKERIKERVETKALAQTQKRVPFPARKKPLIKDYSSRTLIDTSEEKFTQSPGLQHWAAIENLKIAASSYSKAGSIIELEKQIESKSVLAKTARNSLVETERQLKDL